MTETTRKKIKKSSGKYLTETVFERSMASIAQSFAQHDKLFEMMFSELQSIRIVTENTQKTLSSFMHDISVHDEKIDGLTERVETLELKVL